MSRFACVRLVACCSALILLSACHGTTPASPSSAAGTALTGVITDATAHLAIRNARLDVLSGLNAGKWTATDGTGAYILRDLLADTFLLRVVATGYAAAEQRVTVTVPVTPHTDFALLRTPPQRCGDWPGPNNTLLPLLSSPFFGSYPGGNYFDHDLPYQPGNGYQLTSCGERLYYADGHSGYDWGMPIGTPIQAAADGQVTFAGSDVPFFCEVLGRVVTDQHFVEIRHPAVNGEVFSSVYVHLSQIDVTPGQSIGRGQQVGLSGNAGCSTAPHLHFQVWRFTHTNNGRAAVVDPYGWEGLGTDPWAANPDGAASAWLWYPGQAPSLSLR
jgi:hypothetical protein